MVVTPAEPQHLGALAVLLENLDRYYGTTEFEPLDQRMAQIRDALFGEAPAAYALLVWHEADLVGMACYSFLWPAAGRDALPVPQGVVCGSALAASGHRQDAHG